MIDQWSVDQLTTLASRIVAADPTVPFQVPGLSILIERRDGSGAFVCAGTDAAGVPMRRDTLFPIASATKLATGLAVFRLIDAGEIALDAPLARWLPEARAADAGVTPRMLLSHTSGLPLEVAPERYVWREGLSWRDLAHACLETPLQFAPLERVQYSNVGYGLLAQMIERITGRELADALHEMVIAPLGIEAYLGRAELPRPSAAIMDVDSEYAGTEMEPCNSAFWRRLALPWAGMITTIDGLMTLLRVYADPREDLISGATLHEAMTNQTGELGGGFGTTDPFLATRPSRPITWPRCAWGLMLELHGEKRPHWAPPAASAGSFGQIGSTGCLAWYDPERGAAWAFMGTRTTDSGWLLRYGMALGNVALRQGAPRLAGAAADARAVQGCS